MWGLRISFDVFALFGSFLVCLSFIPFLIVALFLRRGLVAWGGVAWVFSDAVLVLRHLWCARSFYSLPVFIDSLCLHRFVSYTWFHLVCGIPSVHV